MADSDAVSLLAQKAQEASYRLATLPSPIKNEVLHEVAEKLLAEKESLQAANARDLKEAKAKGLAAAKLDRLTLSDQAVQELAQGLGEVAALPDPVGEVVKMWRRPNGLVVGKMRIPLGVIGIIYESRPNVTVEAAALCFKAGNAVILRGGSEAIRSNLALAALFTQALEKRGLPPAAVTMIPTTDRRAVEEMLKLEEYIDLIIPRGGEDLIRFVVDKAKMPVIKHYKGVCHIFVDQGADLDMAVIVCCNAKVQRPGVCNAMETLLVHQDAAKEFLPKAAAALEKAQVEIRGCPETRKILPRVKAATEEDWPAEYLDLILAVRVVKDLDEAIAHIRRYGSLHTESILTRDYARAQRFLSEVNSSTVLVNASTRFSDGFQLGLGAEIGISTTKLHAFGPMGLEDLTTTKYIVYGQGQIRE